MSDQDNFGTSSTPTPDDEQSRTSGGSGAAKDPSDWVTGDEPATGPQRSYLETLAQDSGTDVPEDLTKADASKLIDELQDRSPRLHDE
jgi:hypothetical protein